MSTDITSLTPEDITLLIRAAENLLSFSEDWDRVCNELRVSREDLMLVKLKANNYLKLDEK
jgi:hypothetical protein